MMSTAYVTGSAGSRLVIQLGRMLAADAIQNLQPPIFVLEGTNVSVHRSLAAALVSLEGIDVAEDIYKMFDSAGWRIVLRAEGVRRGLFMVNVGTVHVERIKRSPTDVDELRDALATYLAKNGQSDLAAADLATLVDAVLFLQ
jgi:hypothetical protein